VPRLYSVLDTNIYRSLSGDAFASLLSLERNHSVRAIASPWVTLELLAHMATPDSPDFWPARQALTRLFEHCRTYNGSKYLVEFLANVESQIAHVILRRGVPSNPIYDHIGAYAEIAIKDEGEMTPYLTGFHVIAQEVSRIKEEFIANYWEHVIVPAFPLATAWTQLPRSKSHLAEALTTLRSVETVRAGAEAEVARAERVSPSGPPFDRERVVTAVAARCELALRLRTELLGQVFQRGIDLTKRNNANTIFDIHIATSAMMFATFSRIPMWVVTDDEMIHTAAHHAGVPELIVRLDEYRLRLSQQSSSRAAT
jgi:hypothetical protein